MASGKPGAVQGLRVSIIEDFEAERRQPSAGAVASIQVALEAAGVIFVGGSEAGKGRGKLTRIIEHRSALPNGPVVEVHVRRDATADPSVFAYVNVNVFGQNPDPAAFPERLPPTDAFLQALAYAERVIAPKISATIIDTITALAIRARIMPRSFGACGANSITHVAASRSKKRPVALLASRCTISLLPSALWSSS